MDSSGGNIVDFECVRGRAQYHLVELSQTGKLHVSVRGERTLVAARKKRRYVGPGIRCDEFVSIVELDRVVGIDRAPIQAKRVFLGSKRDRLGAATADAQVFGRILMS